MHNNLGDLWRAQGQVGRQAAQQCYSEALRIDNTYAPAWRGLGDMFRENNDHQQAVTCYQVFCLSQKLLHVPQKAISKDCIQRSISNYRFDTLSSFPTVSSNSVA